MLVNAGSGDLVIEQRSFIAMRMRDGWIADAVSAMSGPDVLVPSRPAHQRWTIGVEQGRRLDRLLLDA